MKSSTNTTQLFLASLSWKETACLDPSAKPVGTSVKQTCSSRAGPSSNGFRSFCDTQLGQTCKKPSCKPKPKANGRRMRIATTSDEDSTGDESLVRPSVARKNKATQTDDGSVKDEDEESDEDEFSQDDEDDE
ncbi:hypothetical protein FBEOM_14678, partial [Fusarium beomiforme]